MKNFAECIQPSEAFEYQRQLLLRAAKAPSDSDQWSLFAMSVSALSRSCVVADEQIAYPQ